MPDERLLHLCLGHSAKVNRLSDFERLVWIVYKLAADDYGVMRFSPAPLQDAADWLEQRPAKLVTLALEHILGVGLVTTFTHQGRTYVFQHDWQTWQKITFPRATSHPLPPADLCDLNTQWLFTAHPKGAKLSGWQHPELRLKKSGTTSGVSPGVSPGVTPGVAPELLRESLPPRVDRSVDRSVRVGGSGDASASDPPPSGSSARSKHPIFKGQRLTVFDWMFDDLRRMLGKHTDSFALDEWFYTLDARLVTEGIVMPPRDGGAWLQAETLAEAQRRGLPIAVAGNGKAHPLEQSVFQPGTSTEEILSRLTQKPVERKRISK